MDSSTTEQFEPIKYYFVVCAAVLYTEYLLTFTEEVERFWLKGGWSWGSFFFFLNRYLSVLGFIPIMFQLFTDLNIEVSKGLEIYHDLYAGACQVVVTVLMVMRTYALYSRSKKILGLLLVLVTIMLVLGCWAIGARNSEPIEYNSFDTRFPSMSLKRAYRYVGAWGAVMVLDGTIFALTLYKALTMGSKGFQSLFAIMLRDGTMYFAVMTASNLANVLTFILGGPFIRGINTSLTNILSQALMSRLMLNLRDPRLTGAIVYGGKHVSDLPSHQTMKFAARPGPATTAGTGTSWSVATPSGFGDNHEELAMGPLRSFGTADSIGDTPQMKRD